MNKNNFDVKRKKYNYKNSKKSVVKRCQNIFIWVKKRLVWMFQNREERDNDNETGLKEGGGTEISIYSAPFTITIITFYYSDTINISNSKKSFLR